MEYPEVQCHVQTDNCPGDLISIGPGQFTCLRVLNVEPGQAVVLQGVNFISVDAKVRLAAQAPGTMTREVDTFVLGDIDTPLTEVINGETVKINDCRVHDRLTFQVPSDLPPGIYSFQVVVPNVSGIPILGDPILSLSYNLRVVPPSTARFEISSELLRCRDETGKYDLGLGEDEVRVVVLAYPAMGDMLELNFRPGPTSRFQI